MPRHADAADADEVDGAELARQLHAVVVGIRAGARALPAAGLLGHARAQASAAAPPERDARRVHDERGKPLGRIGDAGAFAAAAACSSRDGIGDPRRELGGEALGRELALAGSRSRRRSRRARGVGGLVLVERRRQRHEDRRPADHRELRHGRGAGARRPRDGLRRCAPAGPRRRAATSAGDAERAHRRSRTRATSSSRACCTTRAARAARLGSRSIAGGTMSLITRAPWLPPKTRSLKLAAVQRGRDRASAPRRAPPGAPGLPVWTSLRRERLRHALRPRRKPVAMAATRRGEEAVGAADARRSARGSRSECARSAAAQHRRHGRIAAEADDRRRLHRRSTAARLQHALRRAAAPRCAIATGEPPDGVADGISMDLVGRERPGIARRALVGREMRPRQPRASARRPAPPPGTGARRCRRPREGRAAVLIGRARDPRAGTMPSTYSGARPPARQRQQEAHRRARARSATSRHRR